MGEDLIFTQIPQILFQKIHLYGGNFNLDKKNTLKWEETCGNISGLSRQNLAW
jgi:hypothetical protein